ncbi:MAG: nucleotidyltransferase family protein [Nitrospinae bacterium]|nr:nucleotidyltransferase family protein [Nitrospinota bacterium]
MTMETLLKEKRREILRIAREYGASRIRIFGSVARGEDRPDSDVDFLVEMEDGRSLLDIGGMQMDLQDLLGRKVDVVTEKGMRPRIKDRVSKEAVSL